MNPWLPIKRFLRSPKIILGEIAGIALVGVVGATVPQASVFQSAWFLALTALASASLLTVLAGQVRQLRAQWSRRLTEAHFQTAPFRAEFERPARRASAAGESPAKLEVWTERHFGLLGSPVFHFGLLLIIVAGALRALFGTEAVVDLVEGETLPPSPAAWAAQWPGVLGQPFRFAWPVTLHAVKASRYPGGDLHELKVQLALQRPEGAQHAELAVNHDLEAGGGRLFLGPDFGPAALLEWQRVGSAPTRDAALLAENGAGSFEGASSGPGGLRAHLRTRVAVAGGHPSSVEVRVMKDNALLFTGDARVGQMISLPDGVRLALHGTPFWARLRGSRDSALWLAYLGFALVMVGATMIFTIVNLDWCVLVTPLGGQERVFVALKPRRFAPLFGERFERMLRELSSADFQSAVSQVPDLRGSEAIPTPYRLQVGDTAECDSALQPSGIPNRTMQSQLACWQALLCLALTLTGCQRAPVEQARQLVERYNRVVSEAYRRGDIKLVDPVVGPNEGRKLTGLIGVRLDLGLTLDSQLLSLEIVGVEKAKAELRVRTKERWRYRDLKIGSGQQVGEESLDAYEVLYLFKKIGKAWLVDEIKFTSPPQVGRKQTPWMADHDASHGIAGRSQQKEARQP